MSMAKTLRKRESVEPDVSPVLWLISTMPGKIVRHFGRMFQKKSVLATNNQRGSILIVRTSAGVFFSTCWRGYHGKPAQYCRYDSQGCPVHVGWVSCRVSDWTDSDGAGPGFAVCAGRLFGVVAFPSLGPEKRNQLERPPPEGRSDPSHRSFHSHSNRCYHSFYPHSNRCVPCIRSHRPATTGWWLAWLCLADDHSGCGGRVPLCSTGRDRRADPPRCRV